MYNRSNIKATSYINDAIKDKQSSINYIFYGIIRRYNSMRIPL